MLKDSEAPPSGEKVSFESSTTIFYQWSFEMFRVSLTVFELFTENQFDHYSFIAVYFTNSFSSCDVSANQPKHT
jgi:hypothetical protein